MENALRKIEETEQRFRDLLKEAPVSTALLTGPDLIIEIANDISLELWGRDASIIGKKLLEAMPEMEWQPAYKELLRVYSTGVTYEGKEVEAYLKKRDVLEKVYVNFTYKAIFDLHGKVTGVFAVGFDVTEQVIARERIKDAEERARLAIESAGIGTFDLTYETGALITSERFSEIFGISGQRTRDEYIAFVHPEDLHIHAAAHLAAQKSGVLLYELRIIHPDGSIHWIRLNGKIYRNEAGKPVRLIGTALDITEQKVSQKMLMESEQRFRTLITETSMVAMGLYIGPEMRIQYVNDVMMRFWGKDASVIGKNFEEAIPELKGQPFLEQLHNVYTTGETYEGKEDIARLIVNGKECDFYFNYIYKALRDSEGKIYGIHHIAIDVTDAVLAKKELMERETSFRTLIMQAPVGICIVRSNSTVAEVVNDAFLQLVGKTRAEFNNRSYWDALDGIRDIYEPVVAYVFSTGLPFVGREHAVTLTRNGREQKQFIDFVCEPLREGNNAVKKVILLAIDVTDKVLARKKIEESRDYLSSIMESLPQMAWVASASGDITYVNKQWKDYTGLKNELDHLWNTLLHPKDIDAFTAQWNAALASGVTFEQEARYKKHSGEFRWHFIRAVPIVNAGNQIAKWVGTCTDIHDQKLSLEGLEIKISERTRDLQRSNIELQQFAYIASHDLQEPLRKIATFTELLTNNLDKSIDDKSKSYLGKITASARRMLALIQGVLNFSQLSRGEEFFTMVDLNEIIAEVKSDFELTIAEKHACIHADHLPVIPGIRLQLLQLFSNLLSNALKFSIPEKHPEIFIKVCDLAVREVSDYPALNPRRSYICLEFKDNGIGFSQEYAEQVFVIFQRLNDRQSYSGTGIGLALCKRIVLNHKGEIYARSKPGEGTSFYIILPKDKDEEQGVEERLV
jgi:PAS domain S-box-containing protein